MSKSKARYCGWSILILGMTAAWLGWQAYIVRERKAALAYIKKSGVWVMEGEPVNWARRMMGDEGIKSFTLGDGETYTEQMAIRFFPEAKLCWFEPRDPPYPGT